MFNCKIKFLLLSVIVLYFLPVNNIFAFGKKDTDDRKPINNEWILCVTDFDITMLPPGRRITGNVITRNLVNKLKTVNYRLRVSPEYDYYEGYAWQQSVNSTLKSLAQKQDERSLYLYKGEPDWKYRKNLKKVDAEIAKLQDDLAVKMAEKPLINNEPVFSLSQANLNGTFPPVPKPGTERRFCQNQKADAFLTGEIMEFHQRFYVKLRLYTLYSNSYIYEDDVIFSMDDIDGAVEEISARLTALLAGNQPSAIFVKVDPPESQILINRNYAGRGTVPVREQPPGEVTIAVGLEGYTPAFIETELNAGELAEITVSLTPLQYADVNLAIKPAVIKGIPMEAPADVSFYQGALYVGKSPLTLRLPIDQLNYIYAEASGGKQAKAVFLSPEMPGEVSDISLITKIPPPAGERRVNKARERYYWSWGATWITGITAWVTAGIYATQAEAISQTADKNFYDRGQVMYYISNGALVLFGAAVVYNIYQEVMYLRTASEGATPIIRRERTKL